MKSLYAVFSDIESKILLELDKASFSIQIAMAWWTSKPLAKKIIEKARMGVQVEVIVNDDNPFYMHKYPDNEFIPRGLLEAGVILLSYEVPRPGTFHHKYCIIDEQLVITGSFNWTYNGENNNEENIVVINDTNLVKSYLERFYYLLPKAHLYGISKNIPSIQFWASNKFTKKNSLVDIQWNIQNYDTFQLDDLLESSESQGKVSLIFNTDTTLKIKATKGTEELTKHINIRLFKEPSIELFLRTKNFNSANWLDAEPIDGVNAFHIFEGQPIKLEWQSENVDKLLIDGQLYEGTDGMTGINSGNSRTILVEAFNRDRRIEKVINLYVTSIPKFETFKVPMPDPIEIKIDVNIENIAIPSNLTLLDTPLLRKFNFPTMKDLKVTINSNKPTLSEQPQLSSLYESTLTKDIERFTETVRSKTEYIRPSFKEIWKSHLKSNREIINYIKQFFKPNGK